MVWVYWGNSESDSRLCRYWISAKCYLRRFSYTKAHRGAISLSKGTEGCLIARYLSIVSSWPALQTWPSNAKDDRSQKRNYRLCTLLLFFFHITQTTAPICTNFGGHIYPWVFWLLAKNWTQTDTVWLFNNPSTKIALFRNGSKPSWQDISQILCFTQPILIPT
jgi:hypothetical protein